MWKRKKCRYGMLVVLLVLVLIVSGCTMPEAQHAQKKGKKNATAVEFQVVYSAHITSVADAAKAIRQEGQRQRKKYDNPRGKKIERAMQKKYDILAVNLGEMPEEMAKQVAKAFSYMYQRYPVLQGTLTNVTIGNFGVKKGARIAQTMHGEFIINKEYGTIPYVEKYQIVLGAKMFCNPKAFQKTCRSMVKDGFWPEGSNPSSVVVHEIGHQLLEVIMQQHFGVQQPIYITSENVEQYGAYNADGLAKRQTVAKSIVKTAYKEYKAAAAEGETGSLAAFCNSISRYARGKQEDGGISYSETCAEAIADVYLHQDNAKEASRRIEEVMVRRINKEK